MGVAEGLEGGGASGRVQTQSLFSPYCQSDPVYRCGGRRSGVNRTLSTGVEVGGQGSTTGGPEKHLSVVVVGRLHRWSST